MSESSSISDNIIIPDRTFNKIGDVAEIVGVKPHVLRFWETEFPELAPEKSASGQRVYRRSDVENVLMIKRLLYDEMYSIEGAKKKIRELRSEGELGKFKKVRFVLDERKINILTDIRSELSDIIADISKKIS